MPPQSSISSSRRLGVSILSRATFWNVPAHLPIRQYCVVSVGCRHDEFGAWFDDGHPRVSFTCRSCRSCNRDHHYRSVRAPTLSPLSSQVSHRSALDRGLKYSSCTSHRPSFGLTGYAVAIHHFVIIHFFALSLKLRPCPPKLKAKNNIRMLSIASLDTEVLGGVQIRAF